VLIQLIRSPGLHWNGSVQPTCVGLCFRLPDLVQKLMDCGNMRVLITSRSLKFTCNLVRWSLLPPKFVIFDGSRGSFLRDDEQVNVHSFVSGITDLIMMRATGLN
jgi:hypothetical protein